jgi:hypothetical protein
MILSNLNIGDRKMIDSTTNKINDLSDKISFNVTKSHALSVVLFCAIESDSKPSPEILSNAVWAISDLLGEAEKSENEILKIKKQKRLVEKLMPEPATSGM